MRVRRAAGRGDGLGAEFLAAGDLVDEDCTAVFGGGDVGKQHGEATFMTMLDRMEVTACAVMHAVW